MTDKEFLVDLIETAIPQFAKSVITGNGKDLSTFLGGDSSEKESVFLSWEGFTKIDNNESGSYVEYAQNYIIYFRSVEDIETYINDLLAELIEVRNSCFDNSDGAERFVEMTNGQAYRDNGSDAFGITILIK